jgi:hypothetical protein
VTEGTLKLKRIVMREEDMTSERFSEVVAVIDSTELPVRANGTRFWTVLLLVQVP